MALRVDWRKDPPDLCETDFELGPVKGIDDMLIPQNAQCEADNRQGCRANAFAELRRDLATPSALSDGHRQRLLELARILARVQALGGEYSRVDLSPEAMAAVNNCAAVA